MLRVQAALQVILIEESRQNGKFVRTNKFLYQTEKPHEQCFLAAFQFFSIRT
jgi:hypothetical protein